MKISFITTVFNEEDTILKLLESISVQSRKPDEVIIVDAGSKDKTLDIAKNFQKKSKLKIKLISRNGNRSVGRNTAIENSTGEFIVCTDAGCVLDKNWIKNITKPFSNKKIDVVAGYYSSRPANIFEKSLTPYVLVMKDKLNENNFLPATRSIAFTKSIWQKVEKFDEKLNHNEDYAFAKKLKQNNSKIVFAKNAIVYWKPRKNIYEAFVMFYRFALGDIEARILRPKVVLIFVRYFIGVGILFLYLITKNSAWIILILALSGLYIAWTITKNYRYVKNNKALFYLPLLQFTSDLAVLLGTSVGYFRKITSFKL